MEDWNPSFAPAINVSNRGTRLKRPNTIMIQIDNRNNVNTETFHMDHSFNVICVLFCVLVATLPQLLPQLYDTTEASHTAGQYIKWKLRAVLRSQSPHKCRNQLYGCSINHYKHNHTVIGNRRIWDFLSAFPS